MDIPQKAEVVRSPLAKELEAPSPFRPIPQDKIGLVDHVRVYPPIGIARVGSAHPEQAWIGPEYQQLFNPKQEYKHDGKIRKMACRFRVFGFDAKNNPLGEITKSVAKIKWTVNLVNSKSAFWKFQNFDAIASSNPKGSALEDNPLWKSNGFRNPSLERDKALPSERKSLIINTRGSVASKGDKQAQLEGKISFGDKPGDSYDAHMGSLRLAKDHSLVVIPADGTATQHGSAVLTDDFNTPGYWDTTGDGSIDVEVEFTTGNHKPCKSEGNRGGWLLVGPPKYAPDMIQPTSIFDGIQNLFDGRTDDFSDHKDGVRSVGFYRDVFPVLRRPTELAWTNPDAFGGHGPGGPADFTQKSWLDKLTARGAAGDQVRKQVFFRLRSPDPEIAKGQADPRWMPRLSGNGGRCTSGDPTTWSSLTPYQYKVLKLWSDGDFHVEPDKVGPLLTLDYLDPARFKELSIQDQLREAIKGPLAYGTGQPVYPGIEISWSYLLEQTYDDKEAFRINRKNVNPGDLNRLLSCPWQSDFYLCRNHWWPACRPDSVVPVTEYDRIMNTGKSSITGVVPWERGIRPQHGDVFADLELVSNVDMIAHWEKLGFVGRREGPPDNKGKPTKDVYIEQEREDFIPRPPADLLPKLDNQRLFSILYDLMKFELSTVPCYLYAAWSVKVSDGEYGPFQLASDNGLTPEQNKNGSNLRRAILNIVSEEMLHLSLAGNVLTGLGFKDRIDLAHKDSLPVYPGQILRHPTGWVLNLAPLNEDQLNSFIAVEAPAPRFGTPIFSENASIADTYAYVAATLDKRQGTPEDKYVDAEFQFGPGEVYSPRVHDTGGSIKVTDYNSANKAIETICAQGEGMLEDLTVSPYTDVLHQELSHYQRFKKALEEVKSGNVVIWDLPTNPGANRITYPPELKAVDDLFNAVYLYLLKTIDRLYRTSDVKDRQALIWKGMFPAMTTILTGLADILIHSKLPTGTQAAPTFSYYAYPLNARCWAEHIQKELFPSVRYACTKNGPILERLNVIQVPIMNLGALPPDHEVARLMKLNPPQPTAALHHDVAAKHAAVVQHARQTVSGTETPPN